ncbi:MAG: hypothetical protein D6717_05780 [Gammaproteobacteria bacterium]|nr:MAG: hypothetical protein D6717_05780 [Gammaproteobacteria bacterium]
MSGQEPGDRLLRLTAGVGLLLAMLLFSWQLQVLPEPPAATDWLMLAANGVTALVFALFAFFPGQLRERLPEGGASRLMLVLIYSVLLVAAFGFTLSLLLESRWFPALVMAGVGYGVFDALRRTLGGEAPTGDGTE